MWLPCFNKSNKRHCGRHTSITKHRVDFVCDFSSGVVFDVTDVVPDLNTWSSLVKSENITQRQNISYRVKAWIRSSRLPWPHRLP